MRGVFAIDWPAPDFVSGVDIAFAQGGSKKVQSALKAAVLCASPGHIMQVVAIDAVRCPWSSCCVKITIVWYTLTDLRAKRNLMFSDPLSRFEQ